MKARSRSRSSSSLSTPRMHPPPLVSAVSDPALNVNSNVLLAHLLTNSKSLQSFFQFYKKDLFHGNFNFFFFFFVDSSSLYTIGSGPEKSTGATSVQSAANKHALLMLPQSLGKTTVNTHHIVTTGVAQSIQQSSTSQVPQKQQVKLELLWN